MLGILLIASPVIYLAWSLICLERNYNRAKHLDIPLVRVPVDGLNILYQVLGDPTWAALDRLGLQPYLPVWTYYARRGWNFKDKAQTAMHLGKVWAIVTPVSINVQLSDAEATFDMVTRRLDFPRPTKPYKILEVFGPCISTANGDNWARHRKVLAAPFNENIMSYVWSESLAQATDMAHFWSSNGIKSVAKDTRSLSLNVLAATGFNKSFKFRPAGEMDAQSDGRLSYRDALQIILDNIIPLLLLRPKFLLNRWLPQSMQRIGKAAATFKQYMAQMLEEEMASLKQGTKGSGSLMTALVRAGDSHAKKSAEMTSRTAGLSVDEIFGNIFVINFAGHDTTANTLAFAVLLLAVNADIQDWLAKEVAAFANDVDAGKWEYCTLFPKLVRCRALMYEILRLYPPILTLQKGPPNVPQVIRVGDRSITIPPDVGILAGTLGIHTHPEYYSDPLTFQPSRWIGTTSEGTESFKSPPKGTFFAWADGPQICPGLKFSQVEFVAVIAWLMRHYRLEVVRLNGESEAQASERVMEVVNDCDFQLLLRMKDADKIKIRCLKAA